MKQKAITIAFVSWLLVIAAGYGAEAKEEISVPQKAYQLRLSGKSTQAKEMLSEYLKEYPDDAAANFEYSRTLGYLMDFEAAEKHAALAAQKDSDNARYHCWQGICGTYLFIDQAHHKQKLAPEILSRSIEALEKSIELKPDYHEARLMLVSLYNNNESKHGGDKKKARRHADYLMQHDPDYGLQATMVIKGDQSTDWKIKEYQTAIEKNPDNGALHAGIAKLYARSNDIEAMQKHVDKAIQLDQDQKDVLLEIVFPLVMKKDYVKAKTSVQRYLQLAVDGPAAMRAFATFYLAKIEKMSGDVNSDQTLENARQIDPNVWMTMKAPPKMMFEPIKWTKAAKEHIF
jgi:Flp pilus assembly protein TadD